MSSADDIAAWIRKAGEHPQALLLFAIGAASPSPTSAAQTARTLGVSNDAEKLAKWVAVLKRDAETLYGTSFEDALCTILAQGGHIMKVIKGSGHYWIELKKLLEKKSGGEVRTQYTSAHGWGVEVKDGATDVCMEIVGDIVCSDCGIDEKISVRVKAKEGMPIARRFARSLEAMTRRKGFQEVPTNVTIVQDF